MTPYCAGSWCECERAYRGMGEKKKEDILFHSCLRGGRLRITKTRNSCAFEYSVRLVPFCELHIIIVSE